ncbi:glutamate formimidoyltransferase [Cloacibacillus evryensis]|uniref:glutamate formimidoyltransferase n=1 Tax=Cloacibacillus evryensis TaxID=508460 RepID=A0AAW5K420_9BACT|nr:glutamate formimidoyltransferase [Cloacibacillus evryensis]EHL65729.1 glutamate formiminotransferase [Synergistes sp. 3_1_syn1]MCQ4763046.1 glutamate formimidoyltransferase [Cloacibacillus evryensis]MCQ4815570.1 glutamate formimidoyltransferase [Cloacibacillus evryensis]MEA5034659.1 glutamate formimidoyltransferase [Cloacibacillus evryensis]
MAMQLIECVPNFSEGRRQDVIDEIVNCFKGKRGVYLLDHRADEDHNRLVISLVGVPAPIQDALLEAAKVALKHIDMNAHQGGHPRIGAVDVVPFTPIKGISMEECIALAHNFGERYYKETGIPVYFYEDAAKRPERKRLEVIRKGQYEVLKDEAKTNPDRKPDIGEACLHPTAGATVIGARKFLVAFNVNLNTTDINIAKKIANTVRASSGGFCHVKGIGLALEERGITQVSMNLVDYEKNSLYRVLEMIRMEAKRWGVQVIETEVYGMIPVNAILESAAYYLQIADFDPAQVLELQLLDLMGEKAE